MRQVSWILPKKTVSVKEKRWDDCSILKETKEVCI